MPDPQPIRLGFVGGGYMGQLAHIENYWKLPGVELVALAEGRPRTAELVVRTYGFREVYPHHVEMLKRAKVDAVVAILPFALNAEVVEDCLNADKHVITEKPQVNTASKGHALAELARRKGLVYQVGYMKRFDPAVRWAKAKVAEWKRSGALGPMLSLRIWCAQGAWQWFREPALDAGDGPAQYPSRLEPRLDWMTDETFSWKGHQGWTNYYSHQTNLARYVPGEDYDLEFAKRVEHPGLGGITATSHFVLCTYRDSRAQLYIEFTGHLHNHWDEGFEVRFARASMTAHLPSPLAKRQIAGVTAYEYPGEGEAHEYRPLPPAIDGFAAQARQFIASVRGEEPPLSPASEAVKEIEFSEALMRLYQDRNSPATG